MMKNYGVETKSRFDFHEEKLWVRTKSRLGICRKKVGFGYRDTMKNHGAQTKSSFDFYEEKLWDWNEK